LTNCKFSKIELIFYENIASNCFNSPAALFLNLALLLTRPGIIPLPRRENPGHQRAVIDFRQDNSHIDPAPRRRNRRSMPPAGMPLQSSGRRAMRIHFDRW
jgi:hypothetical protein